MSDIDRSTSISLYLDMDMGICDYEFHCGAALDTQGISPIWVIVYRFTKSAHFLPVKFSYDAYWLVTVYIDKISCLHGVPVSIVLDRNPKMCLNSDKLSRGNGDWIVIRRCFPSENWCIIRKNILRELLQIYAVDFSGNLENLSIIGSLCIQQQFTL